MNVIELSVGTQFVSHEWGKKHGLFEVVKFLQSRPLKETKAMQFLLWINPTLSPTRWTAVVVPWLCEEGHISLVKLCLANPKIDNSEIFNGAALYASINGHKIEALKVLLADKDFESSIEMDERVCDALCDSINNDSGDMLLPIVALLMKHTDLSFGQNEVIIKASIHGRYEVVQHLLTDPRIDPSADENKALRMSSDNGYHMVVRLLIADKRVDPSVHNNIALQNACTYENRHEVVKVLLTDERVDPTVHDFAPLRQACRYGHAQVVKVLLADPRVDPTKISKLALFSAVSNVHIPVVKELLASKDVQVSGELLQKTNTMYSNASWQSDKKQKLVIIIRLLLISRRHWPLTVDKTFQCPDGEPLRMTLDLIENNWSMVMLLCVKRRCDDGVCGRLNDILRELCEEWTGFRKVVKCSGIFCGNRAWRSGRCLTHQQTCMHEGCTSYPQTQGKKVCTVHDVVVINALPLFTAAASEQTTDTSLAGQPTEVLTVSAALAPSVLPAAVSQTPEMIVKPCEILASDVEDVMIEAVVSQEQQTSVLPVTAQDSSTDATIVSAKGQVDADKEESLSTVAVADVVVVDAVVDAAIAVDVAVNTAVAVAGVAGTKEEDAETSVQTLALDDSDNSDDIARVEQQLSPKKEKKKTQRAQVTLVNKTVASNDNIQNKKLRDMDVIVSATLAPLASGSWSVAEDEALCAWWQTQQHENGKPTNWTDAAATVITRDAKRCRERWINVLRPGLITGRLTGKEEAKLRYLFNQYKGNMIMVAKHFPQEFPNRGPRVLRNFLRKKEFSVQH